MSTSETWIKIFSVALLVNRVHHMKCSREYLPCDHQWNGYWILSPSKPIKPMSNPFGPELTLKLNITKTNGATDVIVYVSSFSVGFCLFHFTGPIHGFGSKSGVQKFQNPSKCWKLRLGFMVYYARCLVYFGYTKNYIRSWGLGLDHCFF